MLTQEMNDRITRVGPGTPMGELMRRYWHPIAGSVQMNADNPTKEIRLLGEDLVLYRDASGTVGLIEPSCAHRKANLSTASRRPRASAAPTTAGYSTRPASRRPAVRTGRLQVQGEGAHQGVHRSGIRRCGLGVHGPDPAPLLPRWDVLEWEGHREWQLHDLPCNWLQCQENSLDPLHFQWLHRYFGGWMMNRGKPPEERDAWNAVTGAKGREHKKIGFDHHGLRRHQAPPRGDETEEDEFWRIGHPVLFPQILRVPMACSSARPPTTRTRSTSHDVPPRPTEPKSRRPRSVHRDARLRRQRKDPLRIRPRADQLAWIIQGPISDRTTERLGVTDVGVIMYRGCWTSRRASWRRAGSP